MNYQDRYLKEWTRLWLTWWGGFVRRLLILWCTARTAWSALRRAFLSCWKRYANVLPQKRGKAQNSKLSPKLILSAQVIPALVINSPRSPAAYVSMHMHLCRRAFQQDCFLSGTSNLIGSGTISSSPFPRIRILWTPQYTHAIQSNTFSVYAWWSSWFVHLTPCLQKNCVLTH